MPGCLRRGLVFERSSSRFLTARRRSGGSLYPTQCCPHVERSVSSPTTPGLFPSPHRISSISRHLPAQSVEETAPSPNHPFPAAGSDRPLRVWLSCAGPIRRRASPWMSHEGSISAAFRAGMGLDTSGRGGIHAEVSDPRHARSGALAEDPKRAGRNREPPGTLRSWRRSWASCSGHSVKVLHVAEGERGSVSAANRSTGRGWSSHGPPLPSSGSPRPGRKAKS